MRTGSTVLHHADWKYRTTPCGLEVPFHIMRTGSTALHHADWKYRTTPCGLEVPHYTMRTGSTALHHADWKYRTTIHMKEIYFIRHGQTDYNKRRIIQGSGIDSDLNEVGQAQAKAFYDAYKSVGFEVVFISALKRTQQTVVHFIDDKILTEEWKQLNEMGWGDNEGKASSEAAHETYKNMIASWGRGDFDASMPNGESARQLVSRLTEFVEHLKTRPEKRILVCSHGRAMLCLLTILNNQHPREMENYEHSNVGLYKVIFDGETFDMILENDTKHLETREVRQER